jgi:xylulokinase
MTSGPYLLGIDIGTTAVKTLLCDINGRVISKITSESYPVTHPKPGWAEQNPGDWWEAVKFTVKSILRTSRIKADEIAGIGFGSHTDGCTPVTRNGKPLRPSMIWMDRRAIIECKELKEKLGTKIFEITGLACDPYHVAPKILWFRKNQPNRYNATYKFLNPGDFIVYKFTGNFMTDYTLASCTMLFDIKLKKWSEELSELMEIPIDKLPNVGPSASIAGEVLKEAAEETGLKMGTPVVIGGGDEEIGVIGAGATEPGCICDITGMAEPILVPIDKPIFDPKQVIELHGHGVPEKWILESPGIVSGGNYRWFRDQLASSEVQTAKKLDVDPYTILDAKAATISAGSNGLIFLPFTMGSITPEWNPYARGVFIGLSLNHTREHLARAILEGSAYYLRDVIERVEELGMRIREIRAAGGGAKSKLWRQIKADVTGKPVVLPEVEDVSAFAGIILAGVGAKLYKDIEGTARNLVKVRELSKPRKKTHEIYDQLYEIYKQSYWNLKDVFKEIARFQEKR